MKAGAVILEQFKIHQRNPDFCRIRLVSCPKNSSNKNADPYILGPSQTAMDGQQETHKMAEVPISAGLKDKTKNSPYNSTFTQYLLIIGK
jgi:hypothetical protein